MQKLLTISLVFIAAACIDPISLRIDGGGTLVVDGWITNEPGPLTVKVSRSIAFDNGQPSKAYTLAERKAIVSIVGTDGSMISFTEGVPGTYTSKPAMGVIGVSYQVLVTTSNGKKYRSGLEELKPVPKIDAMTATFQVTETLYLNTSGDPKIQKLEKFPVVVSVTDPPEPGNYYRWQSDGIFEFFSLNDNSAIKQCWSPITRIESTLELASDADFNGGRHEQVIALVNYDRPTKFLIKTRQQSLSASAYNYFKKIKDQQTSSGTLFDPPPSEINGNIFNENDSGEVVLGYFGASAIAHNSLLINRFVVSNFVNPSQNIPIRPGDCRTMEADATNIKPEGF